MKILRSPFVSHILPYALAAAILPHTAQAVWTVTTEGAPSGCTHVISDGNWKIGVYRYSDSNWNLGKYTGQNGNAYIVGSGVLDLRDLASDCGVVLKSSNNGALEGGKPITEVYFPDSFESMYGNTFKNDTTLTKVVFQSGFKSIGSESFRGCSGLVSVTFPDTLETIAYYGFNGCSALELGDYTFPNVTTMGDHAFTGCKAFTGTLSFPKLTTISGTYQFEDCTLTGFSAPLLATIPNGMFNRCTKLVSATFSDDLASIGSNAFNNSAGNNLISFYPATMPKLTSFGEYGLRGNKSLSIPLLDLSQSSLVTLSKQALVDDVKVGTVKLPETLTTLGTECLAYGNTPRAVWFAGPPPTTVDSNALNFKARGFMVVGSKHADEWKADERVLELADSDRNQNDYPGKDSVKEQYGLAGCKVIGKWATQTGNYWHWVLEEPPKGLILSFF